MIAAARDKIKSDQRQVERQQIDEPAAVPDGEDAEHHAPCREINRKVGEGALRAGEEERRGVRAGHGEQGVEVAFERLAQPERDHAHDDDGDARLPNADEVVVKVPAVDREKQDRDPGGRQQPRILAVLLAQ